MKLKVVARESNLSKAQVEEIKEALASFFKELTFETIFLKSYGDLDHTISLRKDTPSDLFTKEIDEKVLSEKADIAIHSAKDLPEAIDPSLKIIKLTKGIDPRDALVLKEGYTLDTLPKGAVILASSKRREESILRLRSDLQVEDVRGTIEERLLKLNLPYVYGVMVAEAALIRLKLTHLNRFMMQDEVHPLQGKLALVSLKKRLDLIELFENLDV